MKKRIITIFAATALCAAMFTGCGSADDSQSVDVSGSEDTGSIEAAEPTMKYIKGDFTYDECVILPDYKGIELKDNAAAAVTEADVKAYYTNFLQPELVTDPDATCAIGDVANIDFSGTVDGKGAEELDGEGYDLVLGSGSFISGFEDGVVGMKVGDERDLSLKFPEEYFADQYAGKDVVFHVKLNSIKKYPELTDELVTEITSGQFTNVADYEEDIVKQITEANSSNAKANLQDQAWAYLRSNAEFIALPEAYVNEAMEYYDSNMKESAEYSGKTLLEMVEESGMTAEDYAKNMREYGEETAKSRVLAEAVFEKEGLSKDSEDFKNYKKELADSYGITEKELEDMYGESLIDQYCVTYTAVDKVVEQAKKVG